LTKEWFIKHIEPNWVILDCGANIGYYSILFSQLAPHGTVFAFEPTVTFEMLKDNLAHASARNVIPLRLALGRRTGRINDAIFRIWGEAPERMEYDFATVDDWVASQRLARLDCIKIDVDSYDFEVLQGSERTLKQHNPYVVVELNHALNRRNQNVPMALEWLCAQGYKECLCLEHDNYVFHRTENSEYAGLPYPSMQVWLKSAPPGGAAPD
jgi:FkbM family methyltransferase